MFDNEYFEDKCPDSATSTPVMLPFDAICKYYLAALNSQSAAIVSFDINWFLFGLINKSMIQYLASNNLLKESRRSRFSEDFIIRLQKLMRTILCDRHRRGGIDYTMASALFLKDLCSIMDRGVVFTMVCQRENTLDTHSRFLNTWKADVEKRKFHFSTLSSFRSSNSCPTTNIICHSICPFASKRLN